jgi:hypothetical protein
MRSSKRDHGLVTQEKQERSENLRAKVRKIVTTEQTRGRGNDSSKIFKKEYPAYSVTLRQQCNPDPSAQGLATVKNHKSRRKNLANFEYPQKTKVDKPLTRQGVDEEESLFIHRLKITGAVTPHNGHKMPNTDKGDGERLSVHQLQKHERDRQNVLRISSRYHSPRTKKNRDGKKRCQVPNDFTRN